MKGKVLSTIGGVCRVYSKGVTYNVFPRGIFRHENKNIVAGENVDFDDETLVIDAIEERKNYLIRPRSANVDLMLITMSVVEPELSPELLYKFLTYANLNGIPAAVLFTKLDRLTDFKQINTLTNDLEKLGIKVFRLAPGKTEVIEDLKKAYISPNENFVKIDTYEKNSVTKTNLDPIYKERPRKNLEVNIKDGPPSDKFLWPKYLTKMGVNDSFGYLMQLRPEGYDSFVDILKN